MKASLKGNSFDPALGERRLGEDVLATADPVVNVENRSRNEETDSPRNGVYSMRGRNPTLPR